MPKYGCEELERRPKERKRINPEGEIPLEAPECVIIGPEKARSALGNPTTTIRARWERVSRQNVAIPRLHADPCSVGHPRLIPRTS